MDELYIDKLSGEEFEDYLFNLFKSLGYDVESTPASNDYGADLIISKGQERAVVQAKRYNNSVGISAIQEIIGAKNYYQANKCMVVTNNYFTPNAIELAKTNNVELWDRDKLIEMITLSLSSNPRDNFQKTVTFQEILDSDEFKNINSKIPLILGTRNFGELIITTIDKMPHLLITGITGTGKSMFLHMIISSILYKASPSDVKLLLIDPKMVELNIYNSIPHLLIPVVTDIEKAAIALNWAIVEIERRYKLFAENNVRDINSFNEKHSNNENKKIPEIIIIIDELTELNTEEVKNYIDKLSQMGRAAGIYLIATTQIPNIANIFRNNFPSKITFKVSSQSDSKLVIDTTGAEKLKKRYMLFYPSYYTKPVKIQVPFISDKEINTIIKYIAAKCSNQYDSNVIEYVVEKSNNQEEVLLDDVDELLPEAISLVVEEEQATISLLQRRLNIGYARAARLIDQMEERGIIGAYNGSNPRQVLISPDKLTSIIKENSNFNENLNEQIKNRYYRPNKKGKTFRICLSIIILLIISQFTIVKIDNPVVGFPVLFLIIYISFKLGSWLTNKLFKNKNS